ncbi:MAG: response regulator [Proteobacteria bacterium]|nr:response regulator [Pseudomonadota bacterium]
MKPPSHGEDPRSWEAQEGLGIPENPDGRRILVVEDDAPIREVLVTTLRLSGYRVASAEDGTVALDVARAYKPELILMDLMLPGADGWELTQEIRSDPLLGAPPVIVLSARVREADRQRAFDAGAVHFLPKPCRAGDLLEVIRTFLTEKDEASPEQIADVTGANALPDVPDAEDSSQFSLSGSMEFVVDMEDE